MARWAVRMEPLGGSSARGRHRAAPNPGQTPCGRAGTGSEGEDGARRQGSRGMSRWGCSHSFPKPIPVPTCGTRTGTQWAETGGKGLSHHLGGSSLEPSPIPRVCQCVQQQRFQSFLKHIPELLGTDMSWHREGTSKAAGNEHCKSGTCHSKLVC